MTQLSRRIAFLSPDPGPDICLAVARSLSRRTISMSTCPISLLSCAPPSVSWLGRTRLYCCLSVFLFRLSISSFLSRGESSDEDEEFDEELLEDGGEAEDAEVLEEAPLSLALLSFFSMSSCSETSLSTKALSLTPPSGSLSGLLSILRLDLSARCFLASSSSRWRTSSGLRPTGATTFCSGDLSRMTVGTPLGKSFFALVPVGALPLNTKSLLSWTEEESVEIDGGVTS